MVESALSLSSYFTGTPLKLKNQKCIIWKEQNETPNWQEATSWLSTSVARKDWNSGWSRTNPAILAIGQQTGTRT